VQENKKFFVLILSLLFFLSLEARAEEVLNWDACVKEARKNHPDLVSAEEKLNQAKANKDITRSGIFPQVTGNASESTSKTASQKSSDTYAYNVSGTQLLFDGFKSSNTIAAALEDVKSAQYNYQVISSNIRLRLRTAFIELLRAQDLLSITEDIATRRRENLELVTLSYEAGLEHKGSLFTSQANAGEANFEVAQARRNLSLAQRQLTKELGRSTLTPVKVQGDFTIFDLVREKPDFEAIAGITPLLQQLVVQRESARLGIQSAKANFLPQVYANALAGRTSTSWPPDNNRWSVGLNLSFPIFEGRLQSAQVSKAKAFYGQLLADERSGKDGVLLTLEQSWINLQDAIDNVEVQHTFLQAAQERAKISQAQYSIGIISFDNWTIIEDDLVRAHKAYLDARANALVSQAQWMQAKGGTLDYEN
jgi:outer membrane protein TolC